MYPKINEDLINNMCVLEDKYLQYTERCRRICVCIQIYHKENS